MTRDSFTCTRNWLGHAIVKTQFTCCTAILGEVHNFYRCLSFSRITFVRFVDVARIVEISLNVVSVAAAVAVAVSALLSTSETAIALNLPFYRLTHFWRRNAANLLRLRSVVEHVRSAVELAGTSSLFCASAGAALNYNCLLAYVSASASASEFFCVLAFITHCYCFCCCCSLLTEGLVRDLPLTTC